MEASGLAETRGALDIVTLETDLLQIEGWAASVNAGPVDSFKVSYAGKEFTEFELNTGIPSPDVKKAYPNLDCAANARFCIRVLLNKEHTEPRRDGVLALTPFVNGHEGYMLINVVNPSLPVPSEEDINLVGGGFAGVAFEFLGHFKSDPVSLDMGLTMMTVTKEAGNGNKATEAEAV